MKEKQENTKIDWRIGITWDVLVMGIYSLRSLFAFLSGIGSTTIIDVLLLAGLCYYTYSAYNIQRNRRHGHDVKKVMILGFAILIIVFLLFAVANLMYMMSDELAQDMSYLNILLISALFKSVFAMRRLSNDKGSSI